MAGFSEQEYLGVTFQLLSGESESFSVSRSTNCAELYELAASSFGVAEVGLFWGCSRLGAAYDQPLKNANDAEVIISTVLVGGSITNSFINLVREGRFSAASKVLCKVPKLAELPDESGNTALSWVAYFSRRSLHSLDLICHLLNKVPRHARLACKGFGFLALHEAAWGNAPTAVAVLLCAAYPAAVNARAKDGSTPHDVGRYYHRNFGWPSAETLLELAQKLRIQLQHARSLSAVRSASFTNRFPVVKPDLPNLLPRAIVNCLQVPCGVAARVAMFLATPVLEQLSGAWYSRDEIPYSAENNNDEVPYNADNNCDSPAVVLPALKARYTHLQQPQKNQDGMVTCKPPTRRQRPPRGRCLRSSDLCKQINPDWVEHIRDFATKERGQLAGFRRARHERCGFKSITEVMVGAIVYRMSAYTVRAVTEKQTADRAVWPSKKQLFKDRARERFAKYEDTNALALRSNLSSGP